MLLPEFLTSDDTSDMWKISVSFISCCCRWCRRHQIRQEIASNVRNISHNTSQILQITGSVQFEFYIIFCMSVLVRFGSAKLWVLVWFVRFDSHIYFIIKTTSANIAATIRTWLQKVLDPMRQDWCLQIYFCLMWSKTDLFGLALWTTYANLHQNSYHWLNPPLIETHILQHARICLSNKMTQELQSTE